MTHNLPNPLNYTGKTCKVLEQIDGVWHWLYFNKVAGPTMNYEWVQDEDKTEIATLCSKCHTQPAVLIRLCDGCLDNID